MDEAGAEIEDMDWFRALLLYKYAAIVGLIVKHRRKGGGPDDDFTARVAPRIRPWWRRVLPIWPLSVPVAG